MILIKPHKFYIEDYTSDLDYNGIFMTVTTSDKMHVELREVETEPEICGWMDAEYTFNIIKAIISAISKATTEEDLEEFEEEFIEEMSNMARLLRVPCFYVDNVEHEF